MIRLDADVMSKLMRRQSPVLELATRAFPSFEQDGLRCLYMFFRVTRDAVDAAASRREAEVSVERMTRMFEFGDVRKTVVDQPIVDQAIDETPDLGLAWEAWCVLEEEFNVPRVYALEFVRGLKMDAECVRPENVEDLLRYAYRTGGVLGLIVCHILRVDSSYLQPAVDAGTAMRLSSLATNLVRDFNRGRNYAPVAWSGNDDVSMFRQYADVLYRAARELLPKLPYRERIAVAITLVLHREQVSAALRKVDRAFDEFVRQSADSFWRKGLRPALERVGDRVLAFGRRAQEIVENRTFKRPTPLVPAPVTTKEISTKLRPPTTNSLPVRDISSALRNQSLRFSRDL